MSVYRKFICHILEKQVYCEHKVLRTLACSGRTILFVEAVYYREKVSVWLEK